MNPTNLGTLITVLIVLLSICLDQGRIDYKGE